MTKAELRRQMREHPLPPPDMRGQWSAAIAHSIAALPAWQNARTILLFAPLPREPDVELLWASATGKTIAYPRVAGETLSLHRVESMFDLVPGPWGLREPADVPATLLPADALDLLIIPGVAFTPDGRRLGHGRGYYDRLLPFTRPDALKIGVAFPNAILPEIPTDPHDIPVDLVLYGADAGGSAKNPLPFQH